jgi:hypothetical protein
MSRTYQAVAIRTSSWSICDGVKVCDDIADCGHRHKTIAAAEHCLAKLVSRGSTTWINSEIRDGNNRPLPPDPMPWDA